jgi:hypothetical protein
MAEALDFAHRFVACHHPDADAAVLAGSQARGEGMGGSDHDVVLLFASLPEGAWRKMTLFNGRHVEVFAHDLKTLTHFCNEIDRPSGVPVLPTMLVEGVAIWLRMPAHIGGGSRDRCRDVALGAAAARRRCASRAALCNH